MDLKTKLSFKKAIQKVDGTYNKKELYRILKIAEGLGFEWGTREMYGGGTAIEVCDKVDTITDISIYNKKIVVSILDVYFTKDFKPSEIIYYNEETLAEIRNEEALYGYELPHYKIHRYY